MTSYACHNDFCRSSRRCRKKNKFKNAEKYIRIFLFRHTHPHISVGEEEKEFRMTTFTMNLIVKNF